MMKKVHKIHQRLSKFIIKTWGGFPNCAVKVFATNKIKFWAGGRWANWHQPNFFFPDVFPFYSLEAK
jgi:hypothetical protein